MALDYIYITAPSGARLTFGPAEVVWRAVELVFAARQLSLAPFSSEQYAGALAALLPEGEAWPRDPSSVRALVLGALAAEMARLDARAAQLLAEVDPAATAELLSDWERVVGLPDPCVTQAQTVAQRRTALQGRLTVAGGQSRAYFVALAARLGYTVTVEDFASAVDATAAGIVFSGDEWAHIWRVNASVSVGVELLRVGSGAVGEPLVAWGNEVLECQINRQKPAHTRVFFAYPT